MPLSKKYVLDQLASADPEDHKSSVRFVTTTALAAYTRVGNVITANANGAMAAQDGVTPVAGDDFLLVNGASASDNGIYTIDAVGDGSNPFQLTRRTDADRTEFVSSGMRVPINEGVRYGGKGTEFVLVTPDPIVLNTTALDFEEVQSGGGQGVLTLVANAEQVEIPSGRQMVQAEDLAIRSGDLSVVGDLIGRSAPRNFLMERVPARSVRTVPQHDVAHFTGVLVVDGLLQVYGTLRDVTPDTGADILVKLGEVLPPDNLIFGGHSPAVPRSPAAARAILDVLSSAEVATAIAAAPSGGSRLDTYWNETSGADGSYNANPDVIHSSAFNAEYNRINKWSGLPATFVATLPAVTNADHNKRVTFYEFDGSKANALSIAPADLNTIIRDQSQPGVDLTSLQSRGAFEMLVLQLDVATNAPFGCWHVVGRATGLRGRSLLNSNTSVGDQALDNLVDITATNNTAVGANAGINLTTGSGNTIVGANGLQTATTAANNTGVGSGVFSACTTGSSNTAMGSNAMDSITTSSDCAAFGFNALQGQTGGNDNTAIGSRAMGSGTVTGSSNTSLGRSALQNLTTASFNTAVGANALLSATTGTRNTVVGYNAVRNTTTASDNTAVGYQALQNCSSGQLNTAIGVSALNALTTATTCTAVGFECLMNNTAVSNTAVGYQASKGNTSGLQNVSMGYQAATGNTTGAQNTAIGHSAYLSASLQSNNTAIGSSTLTASGAGSQNTAVGANAMQTATGSNNTAIGYQALQANTATGSVAVGYQALKANTSGTNNTAVGTSALLTNTSSGNNTAVGAAALTLNLAGTDNTAIGALCLDANSSGVNNTGVGSGALGANTTGARNTAVGKDALTVQTAGNDQVAIGYQALTLNSGGTQNTAVGSGAMAAGSGVASDDVAVGYNALNAISSAMRCTAVGSGALAAQTTANDATAVGYGAMAVNTAQGNTAVGSRSLDANTSGLGNTAVGVDALGAVITGNNNTAVGAQALILSTATGCTALGADALGANTTGDNNTGVGYGALNANTTGADNTAVGHQALDVVAGASVFNTALGSAAGGSLTSGTGNTFLGYNTGATLTTGNENILIGAGIDVPAASTSNYLNIGDAIVGETGSGSGQITFRRTTTAGITASTTQTQGQGPLTSDINEVSTVANANDTVTLPTAAPGREIIVINNGANTLQVFPASGDNLGAGLDTATTQTTGTTNRYVAYDSTNWVKL